MEAAPTLSMAGLRAQVEMPKEVAKTRALYDMLSDILDTFFDRA